MARSPRVPRIAVAHAGAIVGIDVETASPMHGAVCAIGVSIVRTDRVLAEQGWLVDPATTFHPRFIEIHGITPAHVEGRPPLRAIWPEIESFIVRSLVGDAGEGLFGHDEDAARRSAEAALYVAHNAPFDRFQIERALGRPMGVRLACTVAMSRRAFPQLGRHDLATVSRHLAIPLKHHDALSDARASALIAARCIATGAAPR